MEQLNTILAIAGSSLITALAQWALYFRKHAAEAKSVIRANDHQEIQNLNLIAKEWREAAKQWKDMADEYQAKAMENMRRIDELEKKVQELEDALRKANKEITKLKTA
jgi:uncharacterized coiled-coil DUF342 family protein